MWNIRTGVCIAVFGGVDGHRDQVLCADIHMDGTRIISGGMDHSLKLWQLDNEPISAAIKLSYTFNPERSATAFPTIKEHFPVSSSRAVHTNYIDCVQFLGNIVLSKVKPQNSSHFIIHI